MDLSNSFVRNAAKKHMPVINCGGEDLDKQPVPIENDKDEPLFDDENDGVSWVSSERFNDSNELIIHYN